MNILTKERMMVKLNDWAGLCVWAAVFTALMIGMPYLKQLMGG